MSVTQAGYKTWTVTLGTLIGITETSNAAVTQTSTSGVGTLTTSLQNLWTMGITSQTITENVGVACTQNEQVVTITSSTINQNVGVAVTQNEWTIAITSQTITEIAGNTVSQNQWTMTINAQDITHTAGVAVTQGSVTGTLKTSLTGNGMVSVVVTAATGVTFVTTANLVIGEGAAATTVLLSDITAAVQHTATGTLKTALSGASTSLVVTTLPGITFLTTADVNVGGSAISASTITAATHSLAASGILKTALTGKYKRRCEQNCGLVGIERLISIVRIIVFDQYLLPLLVKTFLQFFYFITQTVY